MLKMAESIHAFITIKSLNLIKMTVKGFIFS